MASRLQRLVARAGRSENQLAGTIAPTINAARQAWVEAGTEASDYVRLVIANNPDKPIAEILARTDVREALRIPFGEARTEATAAINVAWETGVASGRTAAQGDINVLGLGSGEGAPGPSTAYRASLLQDLRTNTTAARRRFIAAIQTAGHDEEALEQALRRITGDLSRRAAVGANSAAHRAHTEAKEEMYAYVSEQSGVTIRKVWVTRFRPTTCATCARLHARIINLRGQFNPHGPGLVYGTLIGPPRHPHCGCRIVPWIADMENDVGVSLADMRNYASSWIGDMFRAVS